MTNTSIKSLKDIQANDGKDVTIVGTYKKINLTQHSQNNKWYGNYAIQVNDELSVLLGQPYSKESKRSEEESEKFEGKKVIVTGIISGVSYIEAPSIESQPLSVSIPCITEIKSISLK